MRLFLALALSLHAAGDLAREKFLKAYKTHDVLEKRPLYEKLAAEHPKSPFGLYAMAWLNKDAKARIEGYTAAIKLKPDLWQAYCNRAVDLAAAARHKEALSDYQRAADKADPCGFEGLGRMYYHGNGVPADPEKGLALLRRAADAGLPSATYALSTAYREGKGVPKDLGKAFELYEKAAAAGHEPGMHSMAVAIGNGEGVAKDAYKAFEWWKKAAERDCPSAMGHLGYLYDNGIGTAQDTVQAARWLRKAAEAGDAHAQKNLGNLYEYGRGLAADRREAFQWYHKAAQQDSAEAKAALNSRFQDLLAEQPLIPKPTAPANLSLKVAFAEPSGNDILEGEETGSLKIAVSNGGPGPAYSIALSAAFDAVPGLTAPAAVTIGKLEAGASTERTLELKANDSLPQRKLSMKVEAKEGNGFDADPVIVELETRPFRAPRLELTDIALGGTGIVKAGEVTKVTLTVKNVGEGPAAAVKAALNPGTSQVFVSGEPEAALGTLEPGQSKKASFEFFVNKRFSGKQLPVSAAVSEARGKHGLNKSLGLVLGEGAPSVQIVAVKGREAAPAAVAAEPEIENVDAPPATGAAIDPEAFAVVIGVEKYRQGLPEVEYAARDAQSVHAYLTKSMGFDPRNVALLQNELANKTDFEKYLGTWLKNRVTPKSRVLVYYAGHGAPGLKSGESYLVPHDGDPAYAEDTAFPLKRLYQSLAALPTKDVTVILDACFSGAGGRSVIAKGARPLVTKADVAGGAGDNTLVLAATAGDQISTHYPEGRHGLLTYFLLKGLRGAADADKDGAVTTSELYGFVKPSVEREARLRNVEQSPSLSGGGESRVWLRRR